MLSKKVTMKKERDLDVAVGTEEEMGNFVLLKNSFDSLTFDSYDLIPTLEAVYGK